MIFSVAFALTIAAVAPTTTTTTPPTTPAPHLVAIKAARLLDVKTGKLIVDAVVLIEGDRITAVGSKLAIPPGSDVVDAGDRTLLPGLIDAHTHLTWEAIDYEDDLFRRSPRWSGKGSKKSFDFPERRRRSGECSPLLLTCAY